MTDKKAKVKLSLFIVIVSIIVLFILSVFLESLGLFPGSLVNRLSVSKYLKENYSDLDFRIADHYYDKQDACYVYHCSSPEGDFMVTAKGLNVISDGYYERYLKDSDLLEELSEAIKDQIMDKVPADSVEFRYRIVKGEYKDTEEALQKLSGKYELVIKVTGEKITFDEYKLLASDYGYEINAKGIKPKLLQIFYYRDDDKEAVMQYESKIAGSILALDREIIRNSVDTHFIVDLDEQQLKTYKLFMFVQRFYLLFLMISILLLSGIWIFKKYRKLKRGQTVS